MSSEAELHRLIDWLRNEAEARMKQAMARRDALTAMRNMSEAELRGSKKLAERMSGRKLDRVSTTRKANEEYCDMQDRISSKLEAEAEQLSIWVAMLMGEVERVETQA